eukprot:TRINITY_DN62326_c0_g1_i2.p1 TRINITY_DN62326_c0_g1~~TRINITY_DN62326_c0_g1_i2.p1  ORF type:complete len:164 (+),score=16.64 TRINITY_DN62326_c0_g1_i2:159-650(+)
MRRNPVLAADYASRHEVPAWYSDADDLIHDPQVNAVYVATPPGVHEAYTIAALRAGKPVYVEKPMSVDAASCERMAAVAAQTGVKLCVAHYRRALPLFLHVKELLKQKTIGDVRTVRISLLQQDRSSLVAQTQTNWRVDPTVAEIGRAVQQECRDRSRMPSSA